MSWLGLLLLGVIALVVGYLVAEVAFLVVVGWILVVAALVWLVVSNFTGGRRSRL